MVNCQYGWKNKGKIICQTKSVSTVQQVLFHLARIALHPFVQQGCDFAGIIQKKWHNVSHPFQRWDSMCLVRDDTHSSHTVLSEALSRPAGPPWRRGAAGGRGPALVPRGSGARAATGCAPCSGRTWCGRASHRGEPASEKSFRRTFKHTHLMVTWACQTNQRS